MKRKQYPFGDEIRKEKERDAKCELKKWQKGGKIKRYNANREKHKTDNVNDRRNIWEREREKEKNGDQGGENQGGCGYSEKCLHHYFVPPDCGVPHSFASENKKRAIP